MKFDNLISVHTGKQVEIEDKNGGSASSSIAVVSFNKDDVLKVAQALIDAAMWREYQGDRGKHEYLYECRCCEKEATDIELLQHELDCEVLIAQDLLTGS